MSQHTRIHRFRLWDDRFKHWNIPGEAEVLHLSVSSDGMFSLSCLSSATDETAVIEEWIGLVDKKGVGIYEGDIVHVEPEGFNAYVEYLPAIAGYTLRLPDCSWARHDLYLIDKERGDGWMWSGNVPARTREVDVSRLEVIGNIHEHPHLIPSTKISS